MTEDEWNESSDPRAMLSWLYVQGYDDALWAFVVACSERVAGEMPVEIRRLTGHFAQVGPRDTAGLIEAALQRLDKIEQRLQRTDEFGDPAAGDRLLGVGRTIIAAFEQPDGAEAARAVSAGFLEWADDAEAEQKQQADCLRRLVPDPSQEREAK